MSTLIPHYWQYRIDDLCDNFKWALAEGDTTTALAYMIHCRVLHNNCPDEHSRAVKAALLEMIWQMLEMAAFSLPPSDEQPRPGD